MFLHIALYNLYSHVYYMERLVTFYWNVIIIIWRQHFVSLNYCALEEDKVKRHMGTWIGHSHLTGEYKKKRTFLILGQSKSDKQTETHSNGLYVREKLNCMEILIRSISLTIDRIESPLICIFEHELKLEELSWDQDKNRQCQPLILSKNNEQVTL